MRLFAGNFLVHFDCFDLSLRLGFNPCLLTHRICLLFLHLLLLFGNIELRLRLFYLDVILLELFRDGRFGYAYGNDLDTGRPFDRVVLKYSLQVLIKLIKFVDVDFVQGMPRAELVDLVMNFVVDPGAVIVNSVVLDSGPGHFWVESVHDLNSREVDDDTALSSAGHIAYRISLHTDLNGVKRGHKRKLCVPARLCRTFKQSTSSKVDADVAFGDLVQAAPHCGNNQ